MIYSCARTDDCSSPSENSRGDEARRVLRASFSRWTIPWQRRPGHCRPLSLVKQYAIVYAAMALRVPEFAQCRSRAASYDIFKFQKLPFERCRCGFADATASEAFCAALFSLWLLGFVLFLWISRGFMRMYTLGTGKRERRTLFLNWSVSRRDKKL